MSRNRSREQLQLLANFIQANCPFEIGDEGAGSVAIRVMGRMAEGIKTALSELGVPQPGYPAPVANAVEILTKSYGEWGKGLEENFPKP